MAEQLFVNSSEPLVFIGNLQGPKGATGAQGIQGIQGPPGTNGTNGLNGTNGIDGEPGAQGIQGEPGASLSMFKNWIYVLGDSFIERNAPAITSGVYNVSTYGVFNLTNMLLQYGFYVENIDGVSGTGVLSGISPYGIGSTRLNTALASSSSYIYLQSSVNDGENAAYTGYQLITAYAAVLQAAKDANKFVFITTIAPTTAIGSSAARRQAVLIFNAWLYSVAPNLYNCIVLPNDYALQNKDSLNYTSNATACPDGTHPETTYAFILAQIHAPLMQKMLASQNSIPLGVSSGNWTSIDPNPINIGTGGAAGTNVTGSISDSYTVRQSNGTPTSVVCSKIARDPLDGAGYWQQIVWTPDSNGGANPNGRILEYVNSGAAISLNAGFAVGDTVQFFCEVEYPSSNTPTDIRWPGINIYLNGSPVGFSQVTANPISPTLQPIAKSGWRGIVATPRFVIPVGTTGMWITYQFHSQTTNPVTIKIGKHGAVNFSRLSS